MNPKKESNDARRADQDVYKRQPLALPHNHHDLPLAVLILGDATVPTVLPVIGWFHVSAKVPTVDFHSAPGCLLYTSNEYAMIDSTIVRAHQHSAGAKKSR